MPFAQHLKIMVVDDTSVSRMLVNESLQAIGITNIIMASDGEQALKSMMAAPCHLVISDFNMPKLDGLQLLQALREYQPTRQVGFILVTGRGDKALIEKGMKWGLNNYLPKPFTTEAMRKCLEQVVGKIT